MDDAVDAGVRLARRVVVVHVDEALETMDRRVLAERLLDAVHHGSPVELGPAEGELHRLPVGLGLRVVVEAQVGELRVGQLAAVSTAHLERPLREHVADLLAQVARARVEHEVHAVLGVRLDLQEMVAATQRAEADDRAVHPSALDGARDVDAHQLEHPVACQRRRLVDREAVGTSRWICQPAYAGETAVLGTGSNAAPHSTGITPCRDLKARWVAYVSAHLFDAAEGAGREAEEVVREVDRDDGRLHQVGR